MKHYTRILIAVGFMAASLLGGLVATALMPYRVGAAPLSALAPNIKITTLLVPNVGLTSISTTFTKIGDIGGFTVENSASLVEVTHQGRLHISSFNVSAGSYFQLRVDDLPPLINSGEASIRAAEANQQVPLTFTGYWQGLSAGDHTISLWVRTANGTATTAIMNPGGWSSNDVIVKEHLPFGTTYLPSIQR